MNISFNGFEENTVTFAKEDTLTKAGVPVKITADGTVAPCEQGDKICGVATAVRGDYAAVQLKGFVQLKTQEEIPTGFVKIAAAADGKAMVSESGREVLVVMSQQDTAGFIL